MLLKFRPAVEPVGKAPKLNELNNLSCCWMQVKLPDPPNGVTDAGPLMTKFWSKPGPPIVKVLAALQSPGAALAIDPPAKNMAAVAAKVHCNDATLFTELPHLARTRSPA